MNIIIANMLKRRSVRVYKKEQIRDEDLKIILECALYAPTGGNHQYSRFYVIQDPYIMEELNAIICDELASREIVEGQYINKGILQARKEGCHFFYHAPTLISAVSLRYHSNSMADCANALQNMQLAATALGLGACWINQPHWLTDVPRIRAIFEHLGLLEDEDIFGSISVGYPEYIAQKAGPRKEGRVVLDIPRQL